MKNVCKKPCPECVYSFNPITCLAPYFKIDAYKPITETGLKRILAVLQTRLNLGSSIYTSDFGKGQRNLDLVASKNIEDVLKRDYSS